MNEPIDALIAEMLLDLVVDPSGNTAILTYRHNAPIFLGSLETVGISSRHSLSQNLHNLFARSVSEENVGEDETIAFVQRLIDWDYIPISPAEGGERAYGEHYAFNRQQIFGQLTHFRRMRKLARELRASLGPIDFNRIASADYGNTIS